MLRRRMMRRLPSEYQEVEYLESTGVQWIDTGIILSNNQYNKLECLFCSTNNASSYRWIIGGGTSKQSCFAFANNGGNLYTEIEGSNRNWTSITLNTWYTATIQANTLTLNDTVYNHNKPFVYSGATVGLFSCRWGTIQYDNLFYGKIKNAVITDNNDKVRSFLPAYRISDHKPCMFDLVSQQPFFNQGSGADFLLGPNVYSN